MEPVEVMTRLDDLARELGKRSDELGQVERELGGYEKPDGEIVLGVEEEYEHALDTLETAMYDRAEKDDVRLPSESMRLRLARRSMSDELLGRYSMLMSRRRRLEKKISALRSDVDAQRSILSALKEEMAATGAGIGRAA